MEVDGFKLGLGGGDKGAYGLVERHCWEHAVAPGPGENGMG